jgi:spermidine/putrescine transport system ATP-binding protein
VDSVNLSIFDGEFLTILGPSGSGKTTILRMIAGFEQPTSGKIMMTGEDIIDVPVNRRPFNTVFQDYALFPHMTVFKNIAYGLTVRHVNSRQIKERVSEALERVALAGYGGRYPDQLSGGQRQRVALARSLILRPRLLLLDEPLGALDLALRKRMQITLKKIQENVKITFLHVTHDQEEGLSISDRIVIINDGKIQQIDSPKEIYFKPSCYFAAKFMGENNLIEGTITGTGRGKVRIATAVGEFACSSKNSAAGFETGREVFMVIRPENIFIFKGGERSYENSMDAYVKRAVFIGSEEKIILGTKSLPDLEIMVKSHSYESGFHRGEVAIGWDADKCWLIFKEKDARETWAQE